MKRYHTQSEKSKILSELSRSGLSASAFCRKRGMAVSTLYKWQKEQKEVRNDFIELSTKESYELKVGKVILRVPASESVHKISELVKALGC